ADDLHVVHRVTGEAGHRAEIDGRALESAALILQLRLACGKATVLGDAHLHADAGAESRTGGAEHLRPAHNQFYRPSRLARQRQRDRLDEKRGVSSPDATDLA